MPIILDNVLSFGEEMDIIEEPVKDTPIWKTVRDIQEQIRNDIKKHSYYYQIQPNQGNSVSRDWWKNEYRNSLGPNSLGPTQWPISY